MVYVSARSHGPFQMLLLVFIVGGRGRDAKEI